jgi:hypothetical protein
MSGSTDDRIGRFLQKHADEMAAEKSAEEEARAETERRRELRGRVRSVWSEKSQMIPGILRELNGKLATVNLQLSFQDTGSAAPEAVATGRIMGKFKDIHVDIIVRVRENAEIEMERLDLRSKIFDIDDASPSKISIFDAGKSDFESLILDALAIR